VKQLIKMKTNTLYSIILFVCLQSLCFAQQTPAKKQNTAITLTQAIAHIGNGTIIENATLVFENGIITAIGDANTPTKGQTISVEGQHIYPGFIAAASTLGLGEIDNVRATNDDDELGDFIPNVRSLIAYNAESKVVESMRPNGVLLGQIAPQGGRISGTSSIVQFDAWNWEDAAIKTDDGIHLHWPSSFRRGRWWMGEPRGYQPNKNYTNQLQKVVDYVAQSKVYSNNKSDALNEGFNAMKGLFDGTKTLYLYAQGEREIIDGITQLKSQGVSKIVLVGGYEAYKIPSFLKQHDIAVLVNRVHSTPQLHDEDYDITFKLPVLLAQEGITVGLLANGQMERMNTRNLPFYAGHLVGYGLDKEKALSLITSNTAKILGIHDKYGTLEVGKSATLFVSKGDALDMRTNVLTHAFIDGRSISLESHQTELWKRYDSKYKSE